MAKLYLTFEDEFLNIDKDNTNTKLQTKQFKFLNSNVHCSIVLILLYILCCFTDYGHPMQA